MYQSNNNSKTLPVIGLVERIQVGDEERISCIMDDMRALHVKEIRLEFSLTKMEELQTIKWYDRLFPLISSEFKILPCLLDDILTTENTFNDSDEPFLNFKHTEDLLKIFINRYGTYFDTIELHNKARQSSFGILLNKQLPKYLTLLADCAEQIKIIGKRTILGGISPFDAELLQFMFVNEMMTNIDVIGIQFLNSDHHYQHWKGWQYHLNKIQQVLLANQSDSELWITETGFSTNVYDELGQLDAFTECLRVNVDKVFWNGLYDAAPSVGDKDKQSFIGIKKSNGTPKLLFRLWEKNGIEEIEKINYLRNSPVYISNKGYTLITGGAGFIGTNLAEKLLTEGKRVMIYDNLSRNGVEQNLEWLYEKFKNKVEINIADIRNSGKLNEAVAKADEVFHFAAQVAVTTSLQDPSKDFEVNARGTLNVLEAIRNRSNSPSLIFTSTNKVYGDLPALNFVEGISRYLPEKTSSAERGISEITALDFHSPYGCSKGAADQYVLDYAQTYDLPAAVFRMSCIYGPHQFGTEDQGWIAHFMIRAMEGKHVSIFGDGKQVRDILYVQDLVNAFCLAQDQIHSVKGKAFNIGGGTANTISLLELLNVLEEITGNEMETEFSDWRPGDQKYYVSDITKFCNATGWKPSVSVTAGLEGMYHWLKQNMFQHATKNVSESKKIII